MLSDQQLRDAGFTEYKSNFVFDRWDAAFCKTIRDSNGIRYHVHVRRDHPEGSTGYDVNLTYNDGCAWHSRAAVSVNLYSGVNDWTVEQILDWADGMWQRLTPNYYERND
jgi:hypothetical protein